MAYILRGLLLLMVAGLVITTLSPYQHSFLSFFHFQHITMAITTFLLLIFIQAFIMFYFIGVNRLTNNIFNQLQGTGENLQDLFEEGVSIPTNLSEYKKTISLLSHKTNLAKRKVIPWTMMMITLGMMTFMLGAAFDTGMVSREVHKGLAIGFWSSVVIGVTHQWILLGRSYQWLRQIKGLFSIPTMSM